jgi:hypothetical protein
MALEAPRVTFLIVGVQKAGTTSLFAYVSRWTDVDVPRDGTKELHFFDSDEHRPYTADYCTYEARFPERSDEAARPCGEATPCYLFWPEALERIRAYNPAMRIVVILRDPVQRAWSHWRMNVAKGIEQPGTFPWCIRDGRRRIGMQQRQSPTTALCDYSYVERGYYGVQMTRLLALFPRDQVHVMRDTDLAADPLAVLNGLRAFLSLPPLTDLGGPDVVANVGAPLGTDDDDVLHDDDVAHLRRLYRTDDVRLGLACGITFDGTA